MTEPEIAFAVLDRETDGRLQSLRRPLGVHSFGMNLMVLQPRQRMRIHAHEQQEEVYLVLEGELTLLIEGTEHVLGPDHLARVGPTVRRQLINAGPQRVVLLALGGYGDHESRDGRAWTAWEDDGPAASPQEVALPDDLPAA